MSVHKIKLTFDTESVQQAIDELENYKIEIKQKVALLIQALTDFGVEYARAELVNLGAYYTGETLSTIEGYYSPSAGVGIIKAGAWWATLIEFGTGVVGSKNPHPDPDGWNYDVNGHGDEGWIYYNDSDGKFHWTKGMASRPFMYNTSIALEAECVRLAKEVFGK